MQITKNQVGKMIRNYIKSNRALLVTNLPQFIVFFFLAILIILIGSNTTILLNSFATQPLPMDIASTTKIEENIDLVVLYSWEKNIPNFSPYFSNYFSFSHFSTRTINGSTFIGDAPVSQSVYLIVTNNLFDIMDDYCVIYGDILTTYYDTNESITVESEFSTGSTTVNTVKTFNISSSVDFLPAAFREYLSSSNYIFVNSKTAENYFRTIPFLLLGFSVPFVTCYNISYSEKTSLGFLSTYNGKLLFLSSSLDKYRRDYNRTLAMKLELDTNNFQNRVDNFFKEFRASIIFYILTSTPLLVLQLIIISKSREFLFKNYTATLNTLIQKGFSEKQSRKFINKTILLMNGISFLILFAITQLVIVLFFNQSVTYLLTSFILFFIWTYIITVSQQKTIKKSLEDYYKNYYSTNTEKMFVREGAKYDLIELLFRAAGFSIIVVFFLLLKEYVYQETIVYTILTLALVILFFYTFSTLLDNFISYIVKGIKYVIFARVVKMFKDYGQILLKLYSQETKKKRKLENFMFILLLIILPTLMIFFDTYSNQLHFDLTNSMCGDMMIENITPESLMMINQTFNEREILPIINYTTVTGINYYFTRPTQYADFLNYTISKSKIEEKSKPPLKPFYSMMKNPYNVIISEKLATTFNLKVNDTLILPVAGGVALLENNSVSVLFNYTVYAIYDNLPFLSPQNEVWAMAWIGPEMTTMVTNNTQLEENGNYTYPQLDQSLIKTVLIKNKENRILEKAKLLLLAHCPQLKISIKDAEEYINSFYPIPKNLLYTFYYIQLVFSATLLVLYIINNQIYRLNSIRKGFTQLFTRGIPYRHLLTGSLLSSNTNFVVLFIISYPSALALVTFLEIFISTNIINISQNKPYLLLFSYLSIIFLIMVASNVFISIMRTKQFINNIIYKNSE